MPKIRFTHRFRRADDGKHVRTFEPGETANVSDACAAVALAEGRAVRADTPGPADDKALRAPETKPAAVTLGLRRRGGGYYDIVRSDTAQAINHKALRKRDALLLMEG